MRTLIKFLYKLPGVENIFTARRFLRPCHTIAYGLAHTLTYVRVSYSYVVYVNRTLAYADAPEKFCARSKFVSV